MKHDPETTTLGEVINGIDGRACLPWYEIMSIEIPGLSEAFETAKASGDQLDWERANDIEDDFRTSHLKSEVTIFWPEHCLTKKYDGDATYHFST